MELDPARVQTRSTVSAGSRGWLAWVATVVALATGLVLLPRGLQGLSAGILVLAFAVALLAVALERSQSRVGAATPPDLSARVGLGVLGGTLGAVAAAAVAHLTRTSGVLSLFGVHLSLPGNAAWWGGMIGRGAVLGVLLGLVYHRLPGRYFTTKGVQFSLVPGLYLLLKFFPIDRGLGLFGSQLGALTFVFVLLYSAVWGVTAGAVIAWGGRDGSGRISRPLGD